MNSSIYVGTPIVLDTPEGTMLYRVTSDDVGILVGPDGRFVDVLMHPDWIDLMIHKGLTVIPVKH